MSREANIGKLLAKMVKALRLKGNWRLWLHVDGENFNDLSVEEISEFKGYLGVVGGSLQILENTAPIRVNRKVFVTYSGRIYDAEKWRNLIEAYDGSHYLIRFIRNVASKVSGSYVLTLISRRGFTVFRDEVGAEPLYIYISKNLVGFSSARKAFWLLGLKNVEKLPPGFGCRLYERAERFRVSSVKASTFKPASLNEAAAILADRLLQTFKVRIKRLKGLNVGVLFSGGIDSSLTAYLLKLLGLKPSLYTAGEEKSADMAAAVEAAGKLDLKIKVQSFTINGLAELVREVVYFSERFNPMDVSIALPLYVAARRAQMSGVEILFAGQGFDELFGGYAKYCSTLRDKDYSGLDEALRGDIFSLAEANLERDALAGLGAGVRVEAVGADRNLVSLALAIPPEYKVLSVNDVFRKRVLREAAVKLGLPESLAWKPKKAVQFGSGSAKLLRRLASGKALGEYLAEIFFKVFGFRLDEA
jgi:asparagine synthase (glutamine-hydrolysing)